MPYNIHIRKWQMKQWFEDAWWSWECCIYSRFVDYNDNIDRCAFFEELNYGWCQMESEYRMSQPNFDPYNMRGRDSYYSYVMCLTNELSNIYKQMDNLQ